MHRPQWPVLFLAYWLMWLATLIVGHIGYAIFFSYKGSIVPPEYFLVGTLYDFLTAALLSFLSTLCFGFLPLSYRRITFLILPAVGLILFAVNAVYFDFFQRQVNLRIIGQIGDVLVMPSLLAKHGMALVGGISFYAVLMYFAYGRLFSGRPPWQPKGRTLYYYTACLVVLLGSGLLLGVANGSRYYGYKRHPLQSNFILLMFREGVEGALKAPPVPTPQDWKHIFPSRQWGVGQKPWRITKPVTPQKFRANVFTSAYIKDVVEGGKKPNVIFIALESFMAWESSTFGPGKKDSNMPNFDALAADGLTVDFFYANGHQTVRGDVAALCSHLPDFGGPMIYYAYPDNIMDCLPKLAKDNGYSAFWLSGFFKEFHNKQQFLIKHGYKIKELHDIRSFADGDLRTGDGIADEVLYKKLIDLANGAQQPFFGSVITYSTHYPFVVPDSFDDAAFNTNSKANAKSKMGGKFQRTLRYSDFALGKFFEWARKESWFKNTIFVLFGDHTMMWPYWKKLSPETVSKFTNRVAFTLYSPEYIRPSKRPIIASHVDLLPTLADILEWPKPLNGFGHSIVDTRVDVYRRAFFSFENNLGAHFPGVYLNHFQGKLFAYEVNSAGAFTSIPADEAKAQLKNARLKNVQQSIRWVLEEDAFKD